MPRSPPCPGAPDGEVFDVRFLAQRQTQMVRRRESRSTCGPLATVSSLVDIDKHEAVGDLRLGAGYSQTKAIPPGAMAALFRRNRRCNRVATLDYSDNPDRMDYCETPQVVQLCPVREVGWITLRPRLGALPLILMTLARLVEPLGDSPDGPTLRSARSGATACTGLVVVPGGSTGPTSGFHRPGEPDERFRIETDSNFVGPRPHWAAT